jgi:sugar phosphate isomerase/epimerase
MGNISLTFEKHSDALFCWDTGHEFCFTPGKQFMPLFADRLSVLHLHDNRGIYDVDDHMLPYDGIVDYDRVAMELARADFNGTLMMEVLKERGNFYCDISNREFYKRASDAVNKLKKQVEQYKNQF